MSKIAVHDKLMTLRLNCSYGLTNRITDKDVSDEVNQQKQQRGVYKVSKQRFPGTSGRFLEGVHSMLAAFYNGYHLKRTMSSLNKGEVLLPVVFYLDYVGEFNNHKQLIHETMKELKDNWDRSKAEAKAFMDQNGAAVYNDADYPAKADLDGFLKFRMQTLPLPKADTLLDVVGDCIQTDVDTFIEEAVAQAFSDVHGRIKDGLQRMVKQLGNPNGKVYETMTGSMKELMALIPAFNVTGDSSLTLLAEEISDNLLIYSTDDLRDDEVLRQQACERANEILKRMGV